MGQSDDFLSIAGLFCAGMLAPVLVALLFQDTLSLYLGGRQFTYVAAALFGLIGWSLLAVVGFDRRNFVFASVAVPWIAVFVFVPVGGIAIQPDVFEYLFWTIQDWGAFAAAFMIAGFVAVAADRWMERLGTEHDRVPAPGTVAVGIVALVVFAAVVGGAVLVVTAGSTSVSDVEPGVVGHYGPSLNVTVDGRPTELRLRTVAPDGATHTQRISYAEIAGESVTVPVDFSHLGPQDPQAGTYELELENVAGLTVDTATYTVESPSPSILAVETAPQYGDLALDPEPDTASRSTISAPGNEMWIGVVFANRGDFVDSFNTRVLAGDEVLADTDLHVKAGARGGSVFGLSEDMIDRIHDQADGVATIEVSYRDQRIRQEIRLPEDTDNR